MNREPKRIAKPKLLVLELWGLGDLAIAAPFLRAAAERFDVTLLAKPHAIDLQKELWPGIRVIPFTAPWTAFRKKYQLFSWPWRNLFSLLRRLRGEQFDIALSGRWDPRDHFLMRFCGAKQRWGFPRTGSAIFLTRTFSSAQEHRYENWRQLGNALNLLLPQRENLPAVPIRTHPVILIHTGAAQAVRVWPLERFATVAQKLRAGGYRVKIICDSNQETWWRTHGEKNLAVPKSVQELFALFNESAVFIGNDSGPGHLAAVSGLPTFTIFGPQTPELYIPLHPQARWIEGKPCPYKPCSDYCRFPTPHCMTDLSEAEVWPRIEAFVKTVLSHVVYEGGSAVATSFRD